MSNWKLQIEGKEYRVKLSCPTLGKKVILINDEEVEKFGSAITMWKNFGFKIAGQDALIKFRAIKSLKGMSLIYKGEVVPPEAIDRQMSSKTVQGIQFGVILLFVVAILMGLKWSSLIKLKKVDMML